MQGDLCCRIPCNARLHVIMRTHSKSPHISRAYTCLVLALCCVVTHLFFCMSHTLTSHPPTHPSPQHTRTHAGTYQCLQGRLALVEAVWDPSQLSWAAAACISKALAFLAQVPVENQGPVSQLEGHLQQAGFEVRHLQDITHLVVPGFVQFVQAASRGLVVQAPDSIMSGSCRQCGVGGTGEGGGDGCRHAHVPQAQSTTSMSWGLRLRWLRFRLLAAFLSTAAQWKLLRFFEVVVVKGT